MSLDGHFDPKGSTITFSTWVDAVGGLHLEHLGTTVPGEASASYLVAPLIAGAAWDTQAANLRRWLVGAR
jgi:hypothetical protein